jgi:signal transduction histidine kinase
MYRDDPGALRVRIGHRVRIDVADSGAGFAYAAASSRGRGLQLAERRLQAHAPSGELHAERTAAGFAVVMTLPA